MWNRLVTDSQGQAPPAQVMWNIWHTHQVHLSFLQLNLLLPQLLAVKQFHTEVLTQSWKKRKEKIKIIRTYFIWGNACFFNSFRTILPPGKLSCCLDESAEPSETNVWHFQMNFYPPFRTWLPESKGLKKKLSQLGVFLFHLRINPSPSVFAQSKSEVGVTICSKAALFLPGLSGWIASIEENTLLIWFLVAWWG